MKVLIEGEIYLKKDVETILTDRAFTNEKDDLYVKIDSVGYFYCHTNSELIFILPKVFMKNESNTVFGISKNDLFNMDLSPKQIMNSSEYSWVRQIVVLFYQSLLEFSKRNKNSQILITNKIPFLFTNNGKSEYFYLDLIISFISFYKKYKTHILFKNILKKSKSLSKTKWEKTIIKSNPYFTKQRKPIYFDLRSEKKIKDNEEELFTYYMSILNFLNEEHKLDIKIDSSFNIIRGKKFETLRMTGLSKLRKIRYRYFNDILKNMYSLCEVFFSMSSMCHTRKFKDEYLLINNYNVVFEDMVDKLFSDSFSNEYSQENRDLSCLKFNKDGKILDHLYCYPSIFNEYEIFYLADSKYYKASNSAGILSRYKQFTYARNIIQYNIDLENKYKCFKQSIKYRDNLSEGYNFSPNFFIYGSIKSFKDFNSPYLERNERIYSSHHFQYRFFDRDTLFIQEYYINYLFVLKNYTLKDEDKIQQSQNLVRKIIRDNFINFLNDRDQCGFVFYQLYHENVEEFVNQNFKRLLGKCFMTENYLIIAKHICDSSIDDIIADLNPFVLE